MRLVAPPSAPCSSSPASLLPSPAPTSSAVRPLISSPSAPRLRKSPGSAPLMPTAPPRFRPPSSARGTSPVSPPEPGTRVHRPLFKSSRAITAGKPSSCRIHAPSSSLGLARTAPPLRRAPRSPHLLALPRSRKSTPCPASARLASLQHAKGAPNRGSFCFVSHRCLCLCPDQKNRIRYILRRSRDRPRPTLRPDFQPRPQPVALVHPYQPRPNRLPLLDQLRDPRSHLL